MRLQFILLLLITTTIFEIRQKNLSTYSKIVRKKGEITLKWSQLVIETIKNDPRIYQIMLISNYENADNPRIIQDLQENIPILHFNDFYLNGEIHQFEKWYSLSNPRDTTLFILVEFPNKNNTQWTEEIMAFVKQLSTVRIRPKCLIVRYLDSNQTSNYDKFLLKMWRDLFLDVTILDVIRGRATIHRLNPFLNFYKAKSFSKKTPLFPNKLENLNGYPLKVGIMYRPPYVLLKRNSTKHPFDVSGPDAEVGKFFATIMNYRQSFLPSNAEDFGHYGCNISKLTGFNSAIQRNRLQLITITSTTSRSICKKELFENTIFALDHYVAIAPTLKSKNFSISIGNTFYSSILLTFLITMLSWIIVKIFKFEETIWNWTLVIQILFGVASNSQPKKLNERIIFGCLLIIYFYYSCNILISLTDFNFRLEEEREINTLNDLMNTGLQFSSELSKIVMLPQIVDDDDMKKWVRKGRVTTQSECIELLLNYKNITCIMRLSQAELFVGFHMKQNIVKIVPEFIISVGIGYFLEPGSPYVEKLHRIYRLLCEFALLEKWRMKMVPNTTSHQLDIGPEGNLHKWDEKDDMRKVLFLLIGILIAGYVGSIILFFIELLFAKWKRGKN